MKYLPNGRGILNPRESVQRTKCNKQMISALKPVIIKADQTKGYAALRRKQVNINPWKTEENDVRETLSLVLVTRRGIDPYSV